MHDGLAESAPLMLGLALGMRHAFDPDHIVAMSTIVSRERSIARAALLGGAWGVGHSLSLLTVGLAGLVYALIEGPGHDWPALAVALGLIGVVALAAFLVVEARKENPMVPLGIFRSQQFSGANAVTFAVYAALGTVTFLLVVHL